MLLSAGKVDRDLPNVPWPDVRVYIISASPNGNQPRDISVTSSWSNWPWQGPDTESTAASTEIQARKHVSRSFLSRVKSFLNFRAHYHKCRLIIEYSGSKTAQVDRSARNWVRQENHLYTKVPVYMRWPSPDHFIRQRVKPGYSEKRETRVTWKNTH